MYTMLFGIVWGSCCTQCRYIGYEEVGTFAFPRRKPLTRGFGAVIIIIRLMVLQALHGVGIFYDGLEARSHSLMPCSTVSMRMCLFLAQSCTEHGVS